MNDKKYYTDDQRRRYAIDLHRISYIESEELIRNYKIRLDSIRKYRYLSWCEIDNDYHQTSTLEDEGLTLVSYDEFLRINNLKP